MHNKMREEEEYPTGQKNNTGVRTWLGYMVTVCHVRLAVCL